MAGATPPPGSSAASLRSGASTATSTDGASAVGSALSTVPLRDGNKIWGDASYADADASRWVVIFPHYLDSTRKRREGRKISAGIAVERPNATEIFDSVRVLGLRTQLELDKSYCRDCWVPGRVRIELVDKNGSPLKPDVAANRQALFLKVASLIPAHRAKFQNKTSNNKGSGGGGGGDGASGGAGTSKGGKGAATTSAKKKKKGKR